MKKYMMMLLLAGILSQTSTIIVAKKAKPSLNFATYNLTHAEKKAKNIYPWKQREENVCDIIKKIGADLYGFQEVIKANHQFSAIKKTLPGFSYIGKPRSTGIKGLSLWHRFVMKFATDEYCPIFYNQSRMQLLASDTFGINDNDWVPGSLPRICTWGFFRDNVTKKEFYLYNTHLDNKSEDRRMTQAELIINDIKQRCNDKPVVLMGDFNTTFIENEKMKKAFSAIGFVHARAVAQKKEGVTITHVKGKPVEIDHILVRSKRPFVVNAYNIFDNHSQSTSDHNPACATVTFK